MNLRILKKLSKRAAPLLPLLGEHREQFLAERGENYTSIGGHDRKHWERCYSVHAEVFRGVIKYRPKHDKHWIAMHEPYHPIKGTPMVGSMVGYYEPEWEEETAWEALQRAVFDHFTNWDESGFSVTRDLSTTRLVLAAAREIASINRAAAASRANH